MHSELSETIHQIPASIAVLLGDETGKMDDLGKSRAQVLLFDEYVLKIRPADDWNTVDVQILQWLAGKAPAPEVAAHEVRNGQDWLLMTRLRGKELCKPDVMNILFCCWTVWLRLCIHCGRFPWRTVRLSGLWRITFPTPKRPFWPDALILPTANLILSDRAGLKIRRHCFTG